MFVRVPPKKFDVIAINGGTSPSQLTLFQPTVRPVVFNRVLPAGDSTRNAIRTAVSQYQSEDALINAALELLRSQMATPGVALTSPTAVRTYLRLNLTPLEHEVFWCVFLDTQSRVLAAREMFRGTLTETSVYPREVVKAALQINAAAVIFAHNHPSGLAEPSRADEMLTSTLKQALFFVDVKALDHFVIGPEAVVSFVERGLL